MDVWHGVVLQPMVSVWLGSVTIAILTSCLLLANFPVEVSSVPGTTRTRHEVAAVVRPAWPALGWLPSNATGNRAVGLPSKRWGGTSGIGRLFR